jgi:four helix bundle protein
MKNYKDLEVWKESMNLVVNIYELTKSFPSVEKYGLTSQIRRAAVSIPSNIAEGSGRKGTNELIQFLYISLGSLAELETQVEIAFRLDYFHEKDQIQSKIIFIRSMLSNLIKSLKIRINTK